ncbi:hypothetical protein KFK09_003456 [Dendrobium nobile]|uniref:Uncharacterized protein n=1 Tax=Dendrobium nobile TaxID=94219 RepID=A0A8T3BXN4_DENNO|nr:hypothetical protein KFK09_003456 [Dendrobium nobile]
MQRCTFCLDNIFYVNFPSVSKYCVYEGLGYFFYDHINLHNAFSFIILVLQLVGCRVIPWAKANLNYTEQALIISVGTIF